MENVTGINEEKMNKLVLDIYSYSDRVKQILQEIEAIVEKSSSVYTSSCASDFKNTFDLNKHKFNVINKIILSYSEDMMNVKTSYYKRSTIVSEELMRPNIIRKREEI